LWIKINSKIHVGILLLNKNEQVYYGHFIELSFVLIFTENIKAKFVVRSAVKKPSAQKQKVKESIIQETWKSIRRKKRKRKGKVERKGTEVGAKHTGQEMRGRGTESADTREGRREREKETERKRYG
jgi:hypothetical protein